MVRDSCVMKRLTTKQRDPIGRSPCAVSIAFLTRTTGCLLAALLASACIHKGPPEPSGRPAEPPPERQAGVPVEIDDECPASVLRGFVELSRAEDFEGVLALLASDLRVRYDAESLKADHGAAGSLIDEDLEAMEKALLSGGLVVSGSSDEALLPLGAGRAVRLVLEEGGWRVRSLH